MKMAVVTWSDGYQSWMEIPENENSMQYVIEHFGKRVWKVDGVDAK